MDYVRLTIVILIIISSAYLVYLYSAQEESSDTPIMSKPKPVKTKPKKQERPMTDFDKRCFMRVPLAVGDCSRNFGAYYDQEQKECKPVIGCEYKGTIPFDLTNKDPLLTCRTLCIK